MAMMKLKRGRARHRRHRGRSHCGAYCTMPVSMSLLSKCASALEAASSLDETVPLRCRSSWALSSSMESAWAHARALHEASLSSVDVGGERWATMDDGCTGGARHAPSDRAGPGISGGRLSGSCIADRRMARRSRCASRSLLLGRSKPARLGHLLGYSMSRCGGCAAWLRARGCTIGNTICLRVAP